MDRKFFAFDVIAAMLDDVNKSTNMAAASSLF
jgi:predicted DNA repair protein MutK